MGRWNNRRRWVPNRRYEEERRPSPPNYYDTKVDPQEVLQNSALPWEEKFCLLAGIPWNRVLAAKKYIYCYENVLKWNDSAGKDALFDAQERFCTMINGLSCEAPLPDQDMYIHNIDWNPKIDPGLISDLDKEYFNPDEAENLSSDKISGWNDKNKSTDENPWESHRLEDTVDIKDVAQSWNNWGASMESKNVENLWEQRCLNGDEYLKDNKWGSCVNKPFGWNKGLNDTRESTNFGSSYGNPLNQGASRSKFMNEKGRGDAWNNSGGWNSRSNQSSQCNVNSWKPRPGETSNGRQLTNCGDNPWGSKWFTNQNNDIENFDSRRYSSSSRLLSGACRKREGYQEHTWRHKSWKHEGPDSEARQFWGKGRPKGQYN